MKNNDRNESPLVRMNLLFGLDIEFLFHKLKETFCVSVELRVVPNGSQLIKVYFFVGYLFLSEFNGHQKIEEI